MTLILGISAFYHDSAAALLRDGEIVAAVQEERFTREKYDPRFPQHSIRYCLETAGITPEQLPEFQPWSRHTASRGDMLEQQPGDREIGDVRFYYFRVRLIELA